MNILKDIHENKISERDAEEIIENLLKSPINVKYKKHIDKDGKIDITTILGMDKYEYTAYCQGAGLSTITNWRYRGWPIKCCETNNPIDYRNFGWFVKKCKNGKYGLVLL
jgi:hypothetical protein